MSVATTTRPRRSKPAKVKSRSQEPPRVGPEGLPYRPDVSAIEACASTCSATFAYCLTMGGEHVEEHHLKNLTDCMEICLLTASLVSRGSPHGEELMAVCASSCREVADSCKHFKEDAHLRACAGAATIAEDWCRK